MNVREGKDLETSESDLHNNNITKLNKIDTTAAVVAGVDSTMFAGVYGALFKESLKKLADEIGRFIFFPIMMAAGWVQAILLWRRAKLEGGKEKHTIVVALIETLAAVALTIALLGSLLATILFASATSLIFLGLGIFRTLFNTGAALFYWGKTETIKPCDFLLITIDPQKELNLDKLYKFSKANAYKPILIKQADKITLYGYADKQIKLTELTDPAFQRLPFPELTEKVLQKKIILLKGEQLSPDMQKEILEKNAHSRVKNIGEKAKNRAFAINHVIGAIASVVATMATLFVFIFGKIAYAPIGVAVGLFGLSMAIYRGRKAYLESLALKQEEAKLEQEKLENPRPSSSYVLLNKQGLDLSENQTKPKKIEKISEHRLSQDQSQFDQTFSKNIKISPVEILQDTLLEKIPRLN